MSLTIASFLKELEKAFNAGKDAGIQQSAVLSKISGDNSLFDQIFGKYRP